VRDATVRSAAFDWLTRQVDRHGDVLPWKLLIKGFELDGERVPLVSMQGIFKPRVLELPLSIRSSSGGHYEDHFAPEGTFLRYAYRDGGPSHPDNVGLREAMRRGIPLVYFFGIVPGKYLAAWPVYVVDDHPAEAMFSVAVDDAANASLFTSEPEWATQVSESGVEARREYVTSLVRRRLHQRAFRERVLAAYRRQCTLCRLRHEELLDAAHIIGDTVDDGEPVVPNGLALCKLHHAAFDRHFLAIRPDYVVEVRADILSEQDGPTLLHGLQGMHESRLVLPRRRESWPDPARLARRYEEFRKGAA
jgi:putative restriction endonuclease